MRRELSVVGMSLLLYTGALVLSFFALCDTSDANEVLGEWATQGHSAEVRIEHCASSAQTVCGLITWLWEPFDAKGAPIRDAKNPDPRLREQPLIGLSLLREFRYGASGEWTGGQIYNPENGRTYHAFLKLRSPDILEVKGCILFVCDTQVWRRTQSICSQTN